MNMTLFPIDYVNASVLAREVEEQLLKRLDWVLLKPDRVIDLGCGAGYAMPLLRERYPEANLVGIDQNKAMLDYAEQTQKAPVQWICTDASTIPFSDESVDLILSNLMLPWCSDIKKCLTEWRRVLRPEGLLMFTSYGPDTLKELTDKSVLNLIDMHDIGDELIQAGFLDPVLDIEHFTLMYHDPDKLMHELQATQMIEVSTPRPAQRFPLYLTYEIIFAHTWAPGGKKGYRADEEGVVKIPLSNLRRIL